MDQIFKTTDELTKFFIENGWNEHTSFSELAIEEAEAHGYGAVIEGMNKGHKYFKMNVTGNIFDEKGEIIMYNIPTVNEENKRRKIVADEKGNDGIDMDDEPEAPKSEKEVADRPAKKEAPAERVSLKAKLEAMKEKASVGDTEKPMPQKAKGKEETL